MKHAHRFVAHNDPSFVKIRERGTGSIDKCGYVRFHIGGKSIAEHRMVMEQYLGRKLLPTENVHHLNGNRSDNRIENLELWITKQPRGQRPKDLVEYAKEILELYLEEVELLDRVQLKVEQQKQLMTAGKKKPTGR